jgi:hypothetical protein
VADFSVTPVNGAYYATTTQYLDITIDTWNTNGDYSKQWTATSTAGDYLTHATSTVYTLGGFYPGAQYSLLIDDTATTTAIIDNSQCTNSVCTADANGQIRFTYTGGYSTHVFELQDLTAPTVSALSSSVGLTSADISWTTNEDSSTKIDYGLTTSYSNSTTETDTTTRVTSHSVSLTGLAQCTTYHYRVRSTDVATNETVDADRTFKTTGCGGGTSTTWTAPPQPPVGGFKLLINSEAESTTNPAITLSLTAGADTARMALSNFSDFKDASQENYTTTKQWNLCWQNGILQTPTTCSPGTYTVYAKFYTSWGTSVTVSDSITLKTSGQSPTTLDGVLVKYPNNPKVYLIKDNKKSWIKDEQTFNSLNLKWSDIVQIPLTQIYVDGEVIQSPPNSNSAILQPILNQSFTKDLKFGQINSDIKRLQIFLNSDPDTQIAKSGPGSPGKETAYFGSLTKLAVIKFQEKYASDILTPLGLKKGTGIFSKNTRGKVNEILKK